MRRPEPWAHKIAPLSEQINARSVLREQGRTVGLITGCFDILHLDHVHLFRYTKQHCDILLLGLDSDESVHLAKKRLINRYETRADMAAELHSVDFVFGLESRLSFGTDAADEFHQWLCWSLKPDFIVTRPSADTYWDRKRALADSLGVTFLPYNVPPSTSGTQIITALAERPYELRMPSLRHDYPDHEHKLT